ncbi:MAG: hypothetical protein M3O36_02525, partial [Myxococcota bacterium]|nr:hypothetical protein [Myxococcota bacterium]
LDDGATSSPGTRSGSASADGAPTGSPDVAAPTDGDAVDAGPVLTSGDGATAGCPGVFCEDFEKGVLDPAIWTTKVTMGAATPLQPPPVVQMAKAAHGKYALQVHSDPGKGAAYDFVITNKPKIPGHHFGRAYFNATPKPPGAHTEFLYAGTAGFPQLKYLEVASNGAAWQLTFVDLLPGGGESYASGGTVPVSRWACVEWEFADTPDQASVFVDGKAVADFTRPSIDYKGATTGLVGGFTDFGFGYYSWHPNTAPYAFDLYYDDIVLDTKRIGCLP